MSKGKFDLGAFLAPEAGSASDTVREIPVDDILDNPRNFYPHPDNAALAALMESIEANGLLEPPTVVPAEAGKYRLISGHSRMAALRLLAANRDAAVADRFARVPCRVLPEMTEAQEVCAVIEANRQRVKTPALLAQEAERLTEMYVKRREAGEDLPGRIRDRVAEAMQVNKTKLANLSAIRNGLKNPAIRVNWEHGLIPESAALVIARMSLREQHDLWEWMVSNSMLWTINNVREFEQRCKPADDPAPSVSGKREETERYAALLRLYRTTFARALRVCDAREDGIFALKDQFKHAGYWSGKGGGFDGSPKGLELFGNDLHKIFRPWPAVWDMLAVMALQDDPAQPEVKNAPEWQTGNPPNAGEYYCRIDCSGMILYQILAWDGTWAFKAGGTRIDAVVLGWYPLPSREEGAE